MQQELIKAQNLVQVKDENKPIEIIDYNTTRAQGALKDKMIGDCTEEEIKPKLLLIFSMVGLRSHHYPTGQEKQDLHDYIRLKYSKKTLSELVLAFDLAINNELDLKTEDVKVYDQFTISYLAQVMAAYKIWLSTQSKLVKKDYPKMVEEKIELTDEDKAQWICDWKCMTEINIELIPLIFYDFLSGKNLLRITSKQKWDYTHIATMQIKQQLFIEIGVCKTNDAYVDYNKFCNMEANGFSGKFKDRILNRAKRLIVNDYLKDKIE